MLLKICHERYPYIYNNYILSFLRNLSCDYHGGLFKTVMDEIPRIEQDGRKLLIPFSSSLGISVSELFLNSVVIARWGRCKIDIPVKDPMLANFIRLVLEYPESLDVLSISGPDFLETIARFPSFFATIRGLGLDSFIPEGILVLTKILKNPDPTDESVQLTKFWEKDMIALAIWTFQTCMNEVMSVKDKILESSFPTKYTMTLRKLVQRREAMMTMLVGCYKSPESPLGMLSDDVIKTIWGFYPMNY